MAGMAMATTGRISEGQLKRCALTPSPSTYHISFLQEGFATMRDAE